MSTSQQHSNSRNSIRNGSAQVHVVLPALFLIGIFAAYGISRMGGDYASGLLPHSLISFDNESSTTSTQVAIKSNTLTQAEKEAYDMKMLALSRPLSYKENGATTTTSSTISATSTTGTSTKPLLWPAKTAYPNVGALLPNSRIIAYYGNLYSKRMGALGEYPEDQMIAMLNAEVAAWNQADPSTKAIPALHYIVTTAQGSAGSDGKYRFRMPSSEIDKIIAMAERHDTVVFLDIQVGLSDLASELPPILPYLKMPNVHLGIDPEFAMKNGKKPGSVIGTLDATEINETIDYLTQIVKDNNLPPKVLVIHRFTDAMVTNATKIVPTPEVQVVMHMDGWGGPQHKIATHKSIIYPEPVQFTGFKLFYKNDLLGIPKRLLTPSELLELSPQPSYIQYQ